MSHTVSSAQNEQQRTARLSLGFINWAHALDHYVLLIYPTVVIGLQGVYSRSYGELIALGTASFVAFGVFSLPAGWLADRWSRRDMMLLFYAGCGISLLGAASAPNLIVLACALFALGVFGAIYHPVGTAMLVEQARSRGRSLALNGVCGNFGAALAAGITAALAAGFGWRAAFAIPGLVCLITAALYLRLIPRETHKPKSRGSVAEVPLATWTAANMFLLFVVISLCAGLVFHIVSVALPKIFLMNVWEPSCHLSSSAGSRAPYSFVARWRRWLSAAWLKGFPRTSSSRASRSYSFWGCFGPHKRTENGLSLRWRWP